MHIASRLATGAEADEPPRAATVQDRLGEDAACAVAGAEEQDVDHAAFGPQQAPPLTAGANASARGALVP